MLDGLLDEKLCPRARRGSFEESSPGEGIEGSLRLMFMATCDLLRSPALPRRGEPVPLLLAEERRDKSAAFIVAAAASEVEDARGDGVSWRGVGGILDGREVTGEVDVDMLWDRGRELRSGGIA